MKMSSWASWSRSITFVLILMVCHLFTENHAYMVRRDTELEDYYLPDADNYEEIQEYDEVIIHSQGENFAVSLGQTVLLPCNVSAGNAVVIWTKDGIDYAINRMKTIAPESVTIENHYDLIVHDIKTTDLGTYVCSLAGKPYQTVVHTISLKEPARVLTIDATEHELIIEGMNLTITCNVTGNPKPMLIWSKEISENENIKLTSERAQFSANSVTIKNLTSSDAGTYICYAVNDVGKPTAKRINIRVLGKPCVHVHREVINSAPNIKTILECTVHEGGHPIFFHWYKDGKSILENDRKYFLETKEQKSTLIVTPQTAKDFGVFDCVAENPFGTSKRSIKLVQYPLIDAFEPVNGSTFRWAITSHLLLEDIILSVREKKEGITRYVSISVPEVNNHTYYVEYILSRNIHLPGNYSVLLVARNSAKWSQNKEVQNIEIAESVFATDGAIRPPVTISITLCLCLVTQIPSFLHLIFFLKF